MIFDLFVLMVFCRGIFVGALHCSRLTKKFSPAAAEVAHSPLRGALGRALLAVYGQLPPPELNVDSCWSWALGMMREVEGCSRSKLTRKMHDKTQRCVAGFVVCKVLACSLPHGLPDVCKARSHTLPLNQALPSALFCFRGFASVGPRKHKSAPPQLHER